jgi:hypothetical protein
LGAAALMLCLAVLARHLWLLLLLQQLILVSLALVPVVLQQTPQHPRLQPYCVLHCLG